jgi:hypothetical protein
MRKISTYAISLSLAMMTVGAWTFVSCSSDDNIDLGDLDKTIGIGSEDMKVPLGNAHDIKLDDVLSLKEGDAIETLKKDSASYKEGDYQFKKKDDLDPTNVKVNEVHFETFDPKKAGFEVDMSIVQVVSVIGEKTYTFPQDAPQRINEFEVTGAGNDNVVALSNADMEGYFLLNLGLSQLKDEVEFTEIDLYLPSFLELDLDYIKNHHASFIKDGVDFKKAGEARGRALTQDEKDYNKLTLLQVATQNEKPLELKVKRVTGVKKTSPTDPVEIEKGYMVFSEDEGLKLHAVIKMQLSFTNKQLASEFTGTGKRSIDPEISMPEGINVTHAEGIFDPDINITPSNVPIGDDVPDFLTDEKVNITMNNPTIKLAISSNINAKAIIKPKMIAYFDDAKTDYKYMYIHNSDAKDGAEWPIIFPDTINEETFRTSYIIITKQILSSADAKKLAEETGYTIERYVMNGRASLKKIDNDPREVTDISQLLSPRIPRSLDFEIEARVSQQDTAKVDLFDERDPNSKGDKYVITPRYEFIAPLALDLGSTIVYNDTIADWNKDIVDKDIELYDDDGEIVITGNVHNNTPLQLKMEPVAIDKEKNEIKDINVKSNIIIKSNLGESEDKVTPIEIILTRTQNGTFKSLDGLAFKVIATSQDPTPLNKNSQFITVTDLKLNLKGRLSVTL